RGERSSLDVSQLLKECIGSPFVMGQKGSWKVVLTNTTYTTPVQEREGTSHFLAGVQGHVERVLDEWGNVRFHHLYTYLQDKMPLAEWPNLPESFPPSWIIATYHEKSHRHRQQLQQAEEEARWATVSHIMNEVVGIKQVITDPDYFKSLAAPSPTEWFDRMR